MKVIKIFVGLSIFCPIALLAMSNKQITVIPPYHMMDYNASLQSVWQQKSLKSNDIVQRLKNVSATFLGKPYQLFPDGEGPTGAIDQGPLYRTDTFDCATYVVTMIALAESQDLTSFQQRYQSLMYKDSQVDFFHRNHFATVDFNANNEAVGNLTNITGHIKDKEGKALAQVLTNDVNKPGWYAHMGVSRVRLLQRPTASELTKIKELLKHYQNISQNKSVSVDYIPMVTMINPYGEVNSRVLKQIPSGSLMEVIYADPNELAQIGTNLQVSHMGFIFDTPQGQIFREASSIYNRVTDVPLKVYLRQMQQNSNILGIHLEQV